MKQGQIGYLLFGKIRSADLQKDPDHGVCPPGSDCAKAAIFRVQQRMAKPADRTFSMSKFVHKTGYDDAD
jgi:hypothetical protein